MALLRRTPLFRTTIDFGPDGQVAVSFEPAAGRWPAQEACDRLMVPAAIAALALARASEVTFERVHEHLRRVSQAVATVATDDPWERCRAVAGLQLAPAVGSPNPRVSVQMVKSALGPVPTIGRTRHSSTILAGASAAALAVSSSETTGEARLACALTFEGLLGWYLRRGERVHQPHRPLRVGEHGGKTFDQAALADDQHDPLRVAAVPPERALGGHQVAEPQGRLGRRDGEPRGQRHDVDQAHEPTLVDAFEAMTGSLPWISC